MSHSVSRPAPLRSRYKQPHFIDFLFSPTRSPSTVSSLLVRWCDIWRPQKDISLRYNSLLPACLTCYKCVCVCVCVGRCVCVCAFGATSVKICIHLCLREGGREWANRHANEVGVMTHFCFVIVTQIEIEGLRGEKKKEAEMQRAKTNKKKNPKRNKQPDFYVFMPMAGAEQKCRYVTDISLFWIRAKEGRADVIYCSLSFPFPRGPRCTYTDVHNNFSLSFFFLLRLPDAVLLTVVCKRRATLFSWAVYVCAR